MRLLRYSVGGSSPRPGALVDGAVVPLALDSEPAGLEWMIANWDAVRDDLQDALKSPAERLPLASVKLHAPVVRPGKIFAIGLNYADHIAESQMATPEHQVWFTKAVTSVNGPHDPVEIPSQPSFLDYEVELVVVIGRGGRDISREKAADAVFGYCVGNDFTERMWQHRGPQWSLGKSFDTHAPIGPWVTTADEVADPHDLPIRAWVDGELRQESNTRHLVFDIWDQIAHLSQAMTLEPGDLIFTGTPGGVGAAMDPRRFLQDGQVVQAEVGGLGYIENVCRPRASLEAGA